MRIRRFARAWWLIAVIAAGLVSAGPSSGKVAEPMPSGWSVVPTPNPGYYGNILWGVGARNSADAWAVGVKATQTSNDTLALHWNGQAWTAVPTPNPGGDCQDGDILWGGNALTAVAPVSANDVWAVGSDCYSANTIIEHWNGSAWSLVASPRWKGWGWDSTAALYGVTAVSASDIWAVGYRGASGIQTLVEHYDGSAWSDVVAAGGQSGYLSGISATGPNDVWAVGATDTGNLVEHYDGTSWSIVPTPQPGTNSGLYSVSALSPTDVWAVGSKSGAGPGSATFALHWNGTTWTEVPSPNPSSSPSARNDLNGVVALAPGNVWAVGTYRNAQTNFHQDRTLTMHWDGADWTIVDSPTPGATGQLTSIAATASHVDARGERAKLFIAGFFSQYERNIYDGHYTLPQTLVMR